MLKNPLLVRNFRYESVKILAFSASVPQQGVKLPLFSRIFSNLLYTYANATYGARMTDEILTIREVAELLKINEKTAYKLASAGKLPGFKVGGSWRFERQEIANWIKRKVEEQRRDSKA